MKNKNKQYRIEKGVLLFTQPRSPYFYGKLRVNGKYITQSFAPIDDFNTAKEKVYQWRDEILGVDKNNFLITENSSAVNNRNEYIEHKEIDNDFQFLEIENHYQFLYVQYIHFYYLQLNYFQ